MLDKNNEVLFGEYCKTCKYERYSETDSPCAECLAEPVNLYSHKPVKWEGADGIYAGPPPRPDHAYQRAVKYVPENRKDREKAIARHNIDAEYTGNKVQTIDDKVTDDQYPSATAVKKALEGANEATAQSLAKKIDAPDTCECGEFLAVEEVNEDGVVTKVKGAKVQTDPPDWNENDPTKPGYVKNRPGGYAKTVTETKTIIVEAGTQLSPDNTSDLNLFPSFAVGDIVDITVNGTKYSLTAYNPEGAPPTVVLIGDMLPPPENPEYGWSLFNMDGAISFINHTDGEMLVQFDISSEGIVPIDPKYIFDGDSLSIPCWEEFASDAWASDYSYFNEGWLTMNAYSAKISIEINGELFKNLPCLPGSYGSYRFGSLDTIGVCISNSGYGTNYNYVTVSKTMFPDGIKSAKIYRYVLMRLPDDALPEKATWVLDFNSSEIVKKDNLAYVRDNEYLSFDRVNDSRYDFSSYVKALGLITTSHSHIANYYIFDSRTTYKKSKLYYPDYSRTIEQEEIPNNMLVATNWQEDKLALLNPLPTKAINDAISNLQNEFILPSSTPNSTKKFKISVDDNGTLSAAEVNT